MVVFKRLSALLFILAVQASALAAEVACDTVLASAPVAVSARSLTLDRISGRLALQQGSNGYSATFKTTSNELQKTEGGSGEQLIQVLRNHVDENSPTALRVEEKAVFVIADIQKFLQETQSSNELKLQNGNQPVRWDQRDRTRLGFQFVTITEYGGQVVYHLEKSAVTFVARARYRKYYEFPIANPNDLALYQPALNDVVAFEIKMTSLAGPQTDEFLAEPETVFKPRLLLTNEIADGLKQIRGHDLDLVEKLNTLKAQVLALNIADQRPLNREDQVESFFNGLVILLKADPNFLEPKLAVSYERESYRFLSVKGEFQFTVDRNVKMYQGERSILSVNMKDYLAQPVTFQSHPNEAFAEMKTPIKEKQTRGTIYTYLYDLMNSKHLPTYKPGSGKKSIAKFLEQAITDQSIDRTILDHGTELWISKSASSLDTLPKKNDLITKREIKLAVPFTGLSGEEFKLVISYQPVKKRNNSHIAVLSGLKLYDPNGMAVRTQPGFDGFVAQVVLNKEINLIGIEIDKTVIPFPVRLTSDEVKHYEEFLSTFFKEDSTLTGSVRNLDRFSEVKSRASLRFEMAKLKGANLIKWVVDRTGKVIFGAVLTAGLVSYFSMNDARPTPTAQTPAIEKVQAADALPVMAVRGFTDQAGQPVELNGYLDSQNNYFFYFAGQSAQKFSQMKVVQLRAKGGNTVRLTKIGVKSGRAIYSMSK